ncbi:MAG: RHS repeat-associated core domain-containing protein [Paludibacteraceae bacterium]
MWDGLALVKRDSTNFVNESAITSGNPILAFGKDSSKVLFEDMLGSTVGSVEGGKFNAINRTAFGELESGDSDVDFFTGKPQVQGLGYAFLFRNYRSEQGKWQTADPMGYPDGWNNLAYVNNNVTMYIDWMGAGWELVPPVVGTLPDRHNKTDVEAPAGSYSSSLGYILHNITEIFRSWGDPTITGTPPANPTNGSTYTSTETYTITVTTYTWNIWEDPVTGVRSGATVPNVVVTTITVTLTKNYTFKE